MLRVLLDDEEVDVSAYESYVSDHFNDEFERECFGVFERIFFVRRNIYVRE